MPPAAKITALMSVPYHALKQRYTVHELIGMLGDMKLVVGMRLHSLIFSTIATTPVVGLSYDIKVKSFLHDIGSTLCQPVEDINVESLIAMIDSIVNNGCPRAMEAHMLLRHGEDVNIAAARALLEV